MHTCRYVIFESCQLSLQKIIQRENHTLLLSNEKIILQIAEGLDYIHSLGFVHGGIKPENVLISFDGLIVKLSDFGLTKEDQQYSVSVESIKERVSWTAPEVLAMHKFDSKQCTPHSDIFSAGCVLFFFFMKGNHPFGKNDLEVRENILDYFVKNANSKSICCVRGLSNC